MGLVTRQFGPNAKGSKLTTLEMDNNLYYLQTLGVSGLTYSANTLTVTNPTGGTISVNIASDTNTFITAATYNDLTNTITITDNTDTDFNIYIDAVSGLTVNGVLSATTISGGTLYGDGSNLTGISGGGSFTGGTVTGPTTFTNTVSADTISATTLYVSGNSITRPYKVYTALLTQTGTDAPTAIVLDNTLGGDIVWSYSQVGIYLGTLNGAFPDFNKVFFQGHLFSEDGTTFKVTSVGGNNSNSISVFTTYPITESLSNNILNNTPIEIRVYN